jgi:hypothetical protein
VGALEVQNNTIKAYIKKALPREEKRYTSENCSLVATIMKEYNPSQDQYRDKEKDEEYEGGEINSKVKINEDDQQEVSVPTSASSFSNSGNGYKGRKGRTTEIDFRKKLPATVIEGIKPLQKLYQKKKIKMVQSQIEEWLLSGELHEGLELDYIRNQIGFSS